MRKTASISILFVFVTTLTLPIMAIAAADDCVMPCCRIIIQCCETEPSEPDCPAMVEGNAQVPLLMPVAPGPEGNKLSFFSTSTSLSFQCLKSVNAFYSQLGNSQIGSTPHLDIPLYFQHHSLLI